MTSDRQKPYCPFWDCRSSRCRVSFSGATIAARRCLSHCLSDDHDNCALYLAEALRRSRIRLPVGEEVHNRIGA